MNNITINRALELFLEEDLARGDITTDALIPKAFKAKAVVIAKESGVLAGVDEAILFSRLVGIDLIPRKKDGQIVHKGSIVFKIEGEARSILKVERTLLNLLGHMSGIATTTKRAVDIARSVNPRIRVAATRKTLPGLRFFEKKAVVIGGGDPHRYDLGGLMIIKENHIKIIGNIVESVRQAKSSASFTSKLEVETNSLTDTVKAVKNGAEIIMLDNMNPKDISEVVRTIRRQYTTGRVILEASGGINFDNIKEYAGSGVDVISMGVITNSARALDFSLVIT